MNSQPNQGLKSEQAKLTFLNHAGFIIEDESALLICDPWMEGSAFDGGWTLLYSQTRNSDLYSYCQDSKKQLFIWYSHEHSDHFNVKFVRELVRLFPEARIVFQKTIDRRVISFLKQLGAHTIEVASSPTHLSPNFELSVIPYGGYDSYCYIKVHGRTILNLNDCSIESSRELDKVKKKLTDDDPKIDVLMTQFGYASWAGNQEDSAQRVRLASKVLDRMCSQVTSLSPAFVIPFASFIKFSLPETDYLNTHQNSISCAHEMLASMRADSKPLILSPWQSIDLLALEDIDHELTSKHALEVWSAAELEYCAPKPRYEEKTIEQLQDAVESYRLYHNRNFLYAPWILESLRLRRPVRVWVEDLSLALLLSFRSTCTTLPLSKARCDLEIRSGVLFQTLTKEYGADSLSVNGAFRESRSGSSDVFFAFFQPQLLSRLGYGWRTPLKTFRKLISVIRRKIERTLDGF